MMEPKDRRPDRRDPRSHCAAGLPRHGYHADHRLRRLRLVHGAHGKPQNFHHHPPTSKDTLLTCLGIQHHGIYEAVFEYDEERDHDAHKDAHKPKLTLTECVVALIISYVQFAPLAS